MHSPFSQDSPDAFVFGGQRFSVKVTAAFLALIAVLAAAMLIVGPYPITVESHDTMRYLVEGDYLLKGYRPYVDYHSTHGLFPFLFSAAGLWIAGVSLWAVLIGQILGGVLFAILMFRVAVVRLGPYWAAGLGVAVFLMLTSCTPPSQRIWRDFSSGMWYNTLGFVLEAILFLFVLLPFPPRRGGRTIDCTIVGFCLMGLFLTKVPFAIPTAGTFAVGTLLWPRTKAQRLEGLAVILIACALTAVAAGALGASMWNYVAFLLAIPARKELQMLVFEYLQYTQTISVFLVAVFLAGWAAAQAGLLKAMSREWLLAGMMTVTLVLSVTLSWQSRELIPLMGLIPVALVAVLLRLASASQLQLSRHTAVAAAVLGGVMLLHAPKDAALSWCFSRMKVKTLAAQREMAGSVPAGTSPSLKMLEKFPREYFERIFDGVTLLEKAGAKPGEVLFPATTVDDVTIFTELRYALGSSTWWQTAFSPTPESYPLFRSDLLADTKWILQDRADQDFWRFLTHYRGEYLQTCFAPVAESPQWTLWKRIDRAERRSP